MSTGFQEDGDGRVKSGLSRSGQENGGEESELYLFLSKQGIVGRRKKAQKASECVMFQLKQKMTAFSVYLFIAVRNCDYLMLLFHALPVFIAAFSVRSFHLQRSVIYNVNATFVLPFY